MMTTIRRGLAAVLLLLPVAAAAQTVPPGPTLTAIRAKGVLDCGANTGVAGFGAPDSRGIHQGLDPDICRAITAAIFGDPGRIRFTALTSQTRIPALQSGQVDVVARTFTWTMSREVSAGLQFGPTVFYDGQGFIVHRSANIQRATQLNGGTVCVSAGSTNELNLADWARINNITVQPLVFDQNEDARRAYESNRCDSYSLDASQLAAYRSSLHNPQDHVILPDVISKEPLTIAIRKGDQQWYDIMRWTVYALILAEELGVTQANAEEMLNSGNPDVRRLLGVSGDFGPSLSLDRRWAYNAIRAVGNYGEIFERHIGRNTPIGLERGLNNLWNRGGLLYAPPIR
ncbi:amino acid ABC transporter substrate-binding protein [Muricoccus radiodurans]|uniref:amino acid ABC transporter substrate-binding protein n=1 Tax=Muricoccus radiodurans TaxID=2231721 RepID=UPI003CF7DA48